MRYPLRAAALLAAALLLATAHTVRAQGHGGGGPGGGGPGGGKGNGPGGMGSGPGGMGNGGMPGGMGDRGRPGSPPPDASHHANTLSTMRGGLQVGPPGRWWDDKHFAHDLGLKPEQQKRMDAIFNENRTTLTSHFQTLQDEEARMETLSRSSDPAEEALFAQIDRVAQARASLEKSLTHYLLGLRREMSADQVARLDSHR